MDRGQMREFYCFLHDGNNQYYSSSYNNLGNIVISKSYYPNQQPLKMNPANLNQIQLAFGTNKTYFSGVRSLLIDFQMVGDGADIVRSVKYNGKGYADELYLLLIRYNPNTGVYYKYYEGRLDLAQTKDILIGYSVPCIDSSCWGILSQNDEVDYPIDCTSRSLTAVPILFDGITLRSKFTWQTVPASWKLPPTTPTPTAGRFPLVLINEDGDSSGIISKTQDSLTELTDDTDLSNYMIRVTKPTFIKLHGTIRYQFKQDNPGNVTIQLLLISSSAIALFPLAQLSFQSQSTFSDFKQMTFNTTHSMTEGESVRMALFLSHSDHVTNSYFLFDTQNVYIEADTKADASIVYGRRPIDVGREIVSRGTNNKFILNSNFLELHNNIVLTCGNALREAPNAVIKTSFRDWFKAYDIEYWLAFRIIDNQIWIEPVPVVYDETTNLFQIGEIKDIEIDDAYEYLCNEIEINMNKQDYRHSSGRLEFNGYNTFSIWQYNVKNKLSLISPYRKDCYGMEFIRLDYQQQSTKDNIGDDSVFMVDISDQKGSTGTRVFNFVTLEVNNETLAPIIYYPINNDIINNDKPRVSGVCQPDTVVNIYVDGNFDGTTTSDTDGNWSYDIVTSLDMFVDGVSSGIHTIETTFSDLTGTTSSSTVTLFDDVTPPAFDNIHNNDTLYDNKPYIKGFLETGQSFPLTIDSITVATITGDGSCRWGYQSAVLSNGTHVIELGGTTININVFSFVEIPLVTSFTSTKYSNGFEIVNNLPLVEGVAKAGTKVDLYLDYYEDVSLGTTFADTNGNWSIQLVPLLKADNINPLTPIPNGNHTISTSLGIDSASILIEGFLLNRPDYDSIDGVIDNTVFNTRLTPKHNLLNRMVFWKSIFAQQPDTIIKFENADKNGNFATTLDGITTKENDDVAISDYPDKPLFLPYIVNATAETPFFFAETLENFNNGGLVEATYQGLTLYCLPIGNMVTNDVTRDVQKWKLLLSSKTPLLTLLKLSTPGSIFTLMSNSIFRSDYNTLHFVKYNYTAPIQQDFQPEYWEDWFMNRNNRWTNNPDYIQKVQRTDPLIDQVIVNSVTGTITLRVFNAVKGYFITSYNYVAVTPTPIPQPDIVEQANVDLASLPDGEYFFVMFVGATPIAISERIALRDNWSGTILIDSSNTRNKTGAIFSNGWRSKIRVEGLVEKWVGDLDTVINEDEIGNFDSLKAITSKRRTVLFGKGTGIPDYLYLKICSLIVLDDVKIQGVAYTITKDSKMEPVDKIAGYPMYYYQVDFNLKDNTNGFVFDGGEGGFTSSVVLVVDAGAFGLGGGGFAEINLENP